MSSKNLNQMADYTVTLDSTPEYVVTPGENSSGRNFSSGQ